MPTIEHTCGPRNPCSSVAIRAPPGGTTPMELRHCRPPCGWRQRGRAVLWRLSHRCGRERTKERKRLPEVVGVDLLDELAELVDDLLLLLGLAAHRVGGVVED